MTNHLQITECVDEKDHSMNDLHLQTCITPDISSNNSEIYSTNLSNLYLNQCVDLDVSQISGA